MRSNDAHAVSASALGGSRLGRVCFLINKLFDFNSPSESSSRPRESGVVDLAFRLLFRRLGRGVAFFLLSFVAFRWNDDTGSTSVSVSYTFLFATLSLPRAVLED